MPFLFMCVSPRQQLIVLPQKSTSIDHMPGNQPIATAAAPPFPTQSKKKAS
jgi:hypothetical protein